ncbi:MAG TPA: EAL domain-containing protein [Pseudolabrys sp.]|jgi:diguanylate cyclase (GGDEF)-like protein|nr:EAL domain-containing protein [Pseudolabrys sp.]
MLIRKLLQTRKADAELPKEIRAALIESLFAPIASLILGAVACSIVGAAVALRVGDQWIMANSVAILAVGMLRVASALFYKRYKEADKLAATRIWEHVYEYGAWGFSALLGLLCWMAITRTADASLQMAVTTTTAGYAAAISGRNAGRPFIAVGQLTLCTLPMAVALLFYPDWVHMAMGLVVLMFVYGMIDITMSIRDIIIQALTMTRKEAALAARFEQQANRFDIALNNMSHGLCMLDEQNRLQVWNDRFLELLHLKDMPVRVGMPATYLLRHSIRAGNHRTKSIKKVFTDLAQGLAQDRFDQVQTSPDGDRTIAVSRRIMSGGGSVVILEDVTESKRAQERITHLAKYDDLTGLANRNQFRERINGMLAAMHKRKNHVAIHLIDLDRFKTINDTLGHPIGDKLLKEVASRLKTVIRPGDMITRFGGDEFVVLQIGTERYQDAKWLAERLARTLKDPFDIDGHRIDIGASIGIAMAPMDGVDADQLLKKADMALYAAKNGGGGDHRFFALEMEEAAQERRALELDLREALTSEQFDLYFQPLVDLRSGRVTTCEALMRWRHPRRGMVPPSIFIPIAEETGLIITLGEWALQRACYEAAKWPKSVKVAVNLSPVQFRDRGLALQVVSALAKSGLPAQRLELEVTERLLLEDSDGTLTVMEQLKNLGVSISLDDFGTGYSSLNYLRKFPFQKIKIDQSFIAGLGEERDAQAIIGAVAGLGASLDKTVVAEGIETEEQLKQVKMHGCHEGQGHFFGEPMPADIIQARLEASTSVAQLVA